MYKKTSKCTDRDNITFEYNADSTLNDAIINTAKIVSSHVNTRKRVAITKYYNDVYKPFLLNTMGKMYDSLREHSVSFDIDNKITFTDAGIYVASKQNFINIICFGRTLTYTLKYIAFLFATSPLESIKNTQVILFCDDDTFNHYKNEIVDVRSTPYIHQTSFHQVFGTDDSDYFVTRDELDIIKYLNVTFVHSSHYLMKGIGGKRAVIQYYNAAKFSGNSDDFVCMTIDDNISGIYDLKNCDVRTQNKYDINECVSVSLLDVYNMLKNIMVGNPNIYQGGINKGRGLTNDDAGYTKDGKCQIHQGTVSIYKLNLTKPTMLMKNKYYYNPYFTRFFEDSAFNSEIGMHNIKLSCYHLSFAHISVAPNICAGKQNDHDDDLPVYLKEKFYPVRGIQPVFGMYALYFWALYAAGHVVISWSPKKQNELSYRLFTLFGNDISKSIALPSQSKYTLFTYPLYTYALTVALNAGDTTLTQNICGVNSSDQYAFFNLIYRFGLIKYNIVRNAENKVAKVVYWVNAEPSLRLITFDNALLTSMYQGNCSECADVYSPYGDVVASYCNEIRNRHLNTQETTRLVDNEGTDVLSQGEARTRKRRDIFTVDETSAKKKSNNPCDQVDGVAYDLLDDDYVNNFITFKCRNRRTPSGKRYYNCDNTVLDMSNPVSVKFLERSVSNGDIKTKRTLPDGNKLVGWKEQKLLCPQDGGRNKSRRTNKTNKKCEKKIQKNTKKNPLKGKK